MPYVKLRFRGWYVLCKSKVQRIACLMSGYGLEGGMSYFNIWFR